MHSSPSTNEEIAVENDTDKDDLIEMKEWLQDNYEPWDDIKIKWKKTCHMRLAEIAKNNFQSVLLSWPRYRKMEGYELIIASILNSYIRIMDLISNGSGINILTKFWS